MFQKFVRPAGYTLAIVLAGGYAWMTLRGPQGVAALMEKHREIRQLQEQNGATALDNERRRERIRKLQSSESEQDMEIRKQLKMQRPGETTFILPDAPKDTPAKDVPGPDSPPPALPQQ